MTKQLIFNSLDEVLGKLKELENSDNIKISGKWSLYKTLVHCAQSIEYSISQFPKTKPAIFRKTIGKFVANKFLKQGFMNHNLTQPIDNAPEISEDGDVKEALNRLTKAINDFKNFNGQPATHFVFDNLIKEQYEKLHSMHIANHLSIFEMK